MVKHYWTLYCNIAIPQNRKFPNRYSINQCIAKVIVFVVVSKECKQSILTLSAKYAIQVYYDQSQEERAILQVQTNQSISVILIVAYINTDNYENVTHSLILPEI